MNGLWTWRWTAQQMVIETPPSPLSRSGVMALGCGLVSVIKKHPSITQVQSLSWTIISEANKPAATRDGR